MSAQGLAAQRPAGDPDPSAQAHRRQHRSRRSHVSPPPEAPAAAGLGQTASAETCLLATGTPARRSRRGFAKPPAARTAPTDQGVLTGQPTSRTAPVYPRGDAVRAHRLGPSGRASATPPDRARDRDRSSRLSVHPPRAVLMCGACTPRNSRVGSADADQRTQRRFARAHAETAARLRDGDSISTKRGPGTSTARARGEHASMARLEPHRTVGPRPGEAMNGLKKDNARDMHRGRCEGQNSWVRLAARYRVGCPRSLRSRGRECVHDTRCGSLRAKDDEVRGIRV